MSSALQMLTFITLLLVGFTSSAVSPIFHDQTNDNSVSEAPWAPATQPREFSYNVMDSIKGANQVRHETWKDGTIEGMYALPLGGKQWQVVNYIADKDGFRVLSSKTVSDLELMGGHSAENQTAEVDINRDGAKTNYKVKASEIGQKQKQQQQQQQQQKGQDASTLN